MKSKIMKFFSDLGRSLMMPVAALAACGIILGITSALLKTQVQDAVPFLTASVPLFIITTLNKVSGIVFTLLPVLFAISIAFGLAKEDKGVAAFAGFIGYYTFLVASSCMISTGIMDFSAMKISNILGVDTVDMGALAGIMAGLVTAKLHNKYHKVQFPAAIAFYGGKRFVALVVLVSMTVIGLVMPLIWAPISVGIDGLGRIIRSSGAFGVFIFGTLERLLIPTGLHHVLNSLFRTTAIGGTYHGVEGCLNIFLQFLDQAPLSDMKPYTQFLGQGKMPYMLFGLPAAALAIYRTTPQDKKAKVKALMIAGVAACFVSGITEPLEFSFMFIAPALFVFHAIMGGISFMLMSLLGVIVGNTGGGFIDFLLWGVFQPGSHWYWVIVPWEAIEEKYAALFPGKKGMPAKPLRTALGSLLIQKQLQFSDRELVEEIRENPYFQYFIGLPGYQDTIPFVPSLLVEFRKRLTAEVLEEIDLCDDLSKQLATIRTLVEQQQYMYENKVHSVPDRIVSISQPYIRPIARGKAKAPVEFGAKLDLSIDENGIARLERLSFDAYNESDVFITAVENYKSRTGHYPERVLVDQIYRNRTNRAFCSEHGIRISGPALGRPKKDNKVDKKQEYIDNNDRIEVERAFSLAKRRYGLGLITAKLDTNTKSSIALSIIAMNVNLLTVVSFAQILVSLFSRNKLMHCTVKYMKNKSYKDLAIC